MRDNLGPLGQRELVHRGYSRVRAPIFAASFGTPPREGASAEADGLTGAVAASARVDGLRDHRHDHLSVSFFVLSSSSPQ